jgi:uncharacterized SAM-binding protein YcdF (DUF218 family)
MFILKKIISAFLLPFNVSVFLLAIGIFLLFATRLQRVAKAFVLAGFLSLLFLSMPPTANWLSNSLEHRYPTPSSSVLEDRQIRWIVVLGGGHNSAMPAGQQLSGSSLARVNEGLRIYRMQPGRTVLFSGGGVYDPGPNGLAMAEQAKGLGLPEKDMVVESKSRDTEEQAEFLATTLKNNRFFLVTSAIHMPRAMSLFIKKGMNPIAAPCDFSFVSQNPPALLRILPNASSLQQSERAFRERLGMLYSRLRGKAA